MMNALDGFLKGHILLFHKEFGTRLDIGCDKDIDHIERIDEKTPLLGVKTIRLFGVGGVFGYIGLFRTKGYGTFRSYVTDAKKTFLIHRIKGMPIAISVNEPDEFMPYYLKGGTK